MNAKRYISLRVAKEIRRFVDGNLRDFVAKMIVDLRRTAKAADKNIVNEDADGRLVFPYIDRCERAVKSGDWKTAVKEAKGLERAASEFVAEDEENNIAYKSWQMAQKLLKTIERAARSKDA